jgi:hypothetical protein
MVQGLWRLSEYRWRIEGDITSLLASKRKARR